MTTVIQILVYVAYMAFVLWTLKKIPSSISETWYLLPSPLNHIFTLYCWSIGFLMFIQSDGSTGFFFLSGLGLILSGTAAAFKSEKTQGRVHSIGAMVCIFSAFLAIYLEKGEWLPFLLFTGLAALIMYFKIDNRILWVENAAFICICFGLLT